jgi:hypothetical protein
MKAEFKPRINLEGRTPLETVIPLQTPYVAFVDPASACNFNCKFCPTGHRDLIDDTGRYQGVMKLMCSRRSSTTCRSSDRSDQGAAHVRTASRS